MRSPEVGSLLLDDQLCFALYAASRAVISYYRPLLDELGLTYPQYIVMLVLWERGPVSVRELGTALQLESSTLSPLLKRLEVRGLVRRERRTDDERSVTIGLTEDGGHLRKRARAVSAAFGCAVDLTPEQRATAMHLLHVITANVAREQG